MPLGIKAYQHFSLFIFPALDQIVQLQSHPNVERRSQFYDKSCFEKQLARPKPGGPVGPGNCDYKGLQLTPEQAIMTPAARAFALLAVAIYDDIEEIKSDADKKNTREAAQYKPRGEHYKEALKTHVWIYGSPKVAKELYIESALLTLEQINQARRDRFALLAANEKGMGLPAIWDGIQPGYEAISAETVRAFVAHNVHKTDTVPEQLLSFCLPSHKALAARYDNPPPILNFFKAPIFDRQVIRLLKGCLRGDEPPLARVIEDKDEAETQATASAAKPGA